MTHFFYDDAADMDYDATTASLTIQPEDREACTNIRIRDDDLAMEGDEIFFVNITDSSVPIDPTPSVITIMDNDGRLELTKIQWLWRHFFFDFFLNPSKYCLVFTEIQLNFDDPDISVNENVPGGTIDVCFTPDSPSAREYTVEVARRPSPPNPATGKLQIQSTMYVCMYVYMNLWDYT